MSKPASASSKTGAAERRRSKRRLILGTFSVFAVLPKKGPARLEVQDLSEHGIGFTVDLEGESPGTFPVQPGDVFDLHFYLNQSLYVPLSIKVARLLEQDQQRQIGGDFTDRATAGYKALTSFITMLDSLADTAQINVGQS